MSTAIVAVLWIILAALCIISSLYAWNQWKIYGLDADTKMCITIAIMLWIAFAILCVLHP